MFVLSILRNVRVPGRIRSSSFNAWSIHNFYFYHTNITISKVKMVAPYAKMLSADMKKQFKNTRKENKAKGDKE